MEPITILLNALIAGASAAIEPTVENAIKDSYEGIKNLIKRKYNKVNVDLLDGNPSSKERQSILKEDLQNDSLLSDDEVFEKAKQLLDLIKENPGSLSQSAGITIDTVKAASISIEKYKSDGQGIVVKKSELKGNLKFKDIDLGHPGER